MKNVETIKDKILLESLAEATYNRFVDFLDVLPFYKNINEEGVEIYGKKAA